MKKYQIPFFIIIVIILASCSFWNPLPQNVVANGESNLLPDKISDIPRSFTEPFTFKTLLSVEFNLKVISAKSGAAIGNVIVTLRNEQGHAVYTGKIPENGILNTALQLPAASEDITLSLTADGFEPREVVIKNMVTYSSIDRSMSLQPVAVLQVRKIALMDSDGDLVPDIDDAFPDDPDRAFINRIPAEGSLSIAFEDLFLQKGAGDADYNDFIAQYSITEITNSKNQIVELQGESKAITKLAGYNHRFGIMIDHFNGEALLKTDYIDASGNSRKSEKKFEKSANIVLFESTKKAVGKKAWFSLLFDVPQNKNDLDEAPYNPYLYVYNTGHDIHLIGEKALPGSINPGDNYQDSEGFPWALLVPTDWIHPDESQRIEVHYPRFTLWRESFGAEHSDWYLHYDDPYVPDENQPPYPVTAAFTSRNFTEDSGLRQFQLDIAEVGGLKDPDGDIVYFRSSTLPSWVALDENTGVVTVDTVDSHAPEAFLFWSEDEHGADTKDDPYSVTISVTFG